MKNKSKFKRTAARIGRGAGPILAVACAGWLAAPVHATLVSDDFSYSGNPPLLSQNGGSGWWTGSGRAVWGASTGSSANTSRVVVSSSSNLTSSLYNVTQSGTGLVTGNFNSFRGINRITSAPLTGNVWFSTLLQNGAASDSAGIEFSNHDPSPTFSGTDYNQGPWDVELNGTSLQVRYNGVTSSTLATLPLGSTNLIVGEWSINSAGNDRLQVWVNPNVVANGMSLGTATFDANTADIGSSISLVGVFSYGANSTGANNSGYVDALRVSDGNGDNNTAFSEVTGVPEPASLGLLTFAAAGLVLRRRTDRR